MDNLNPGNDEPVHIRATKIIIDGVAHEAILTSRRLILIQGGTGTIRESIPYADIALAAAGTNALREPLLTLTTVLPDGSRHETGLIFIHQPAGLNIQERDRCLALLAEQNVPVQGSPPHAASPAADKKGLMDAGQQDSDAPLQRPAIPDWTIYGMPQHSRRAGPEEPSPRSPLFTIGAVILVVGICIVAMLALGPGHRQDTSSSPINATGPVTAPVGPSVAVTPDTGSSSAGGTLPRPGAIPPNGIWVIVSYPGAFTGNLKAGGWYFDVNSSVTDQYQLPVGNTMIEGAIAKMDGSPVGMEVSVYNGGSLVWKDTTTKPYGVVDLHVRVGSSVISRPLVTPAPTVVTVIPTPDTSLALHEIPASGVFVRVAYPGNFTGTLTANGFAREVNSSGEGLYQLSMSSGNLDGYLAKSDGSAANMVVQVYRDGTLVSYGNTSSPLGTVDLHTTL
jgi:hypothetical protein